MDPRVEALRPIIATFGLGEATIDAARAGFHAAASGFPTPEGVTIERSTVAGMDAMRIAPAGESSTERILYLHGGGFVLGSVEVQLGVPARLALATGCEVVSVGYRTAPEHPLPAATDDAVDAYEELLGDGPLAAIAGDSAGATLTLLAAVALRERGLPQPGALVAFSPWTDLALGSARFQDLTFEDVVLPRSFVQMAAAAAFGGASAEDPRVTPATADLAGLAPTMIHVGGDEMLLGDSVALADRLAHRDVDVALHVWPGMIHVFVAYPQLAPESDRALAEAAAFIATRHRR